MSGSGGKGFPFAKIVVVLAIAFGVGVGLCGLSFVAASNGFKSHEEFGVDSLGIAAISVMVMVGSAAGLVLAAVAWGLAAIVGLAQGKDEQQTLAGNEEKDEQQTLPGKKDDEQKPQ
jgi:hypothetical protein